MLLRKRVARRATVAEDTAVWQAAMDRLTPGDRERFSVGFADSCSSSTSCDTWAIDELAQMVEEIASNHGARLVALGRMKGTLSAMLPDLRKRLVSPVQEDLPSPILPPGCNRLERLFVWKLAGIAWSPARKPKKR